MIIRLLLIINQFTFIRMDKLVIDYSMNRRRKILYLVLGIFHVILGVAALTAAFVQKLHGVIVLVLILYTALGVVFLGGILIKLHKYLIIDEDAITVKSNSRRFPFKVAWSDIKSVTLFPNTLHLQTGKGDINVPLGVIGFQDVRRIKKQMQGIASQKGIPCIRYKSIRRKVQM